MRLILNYKCKQCGMVFGVPDELLQNPTIHILGLSLTHASLNINGRKHECDRYFMHECNKGHGISELVGFTGEDK